MNWIFWIGLNLLIFYVNSIFAGRIYHQFGAPYWMALLSGTAHVLCLSCVLILVRDALRKWIKPGSQAESVFYVLVGLLALVYIVNSALYSILQFDLLLVLSYIWNSGLPGISQVLAAAKLSLRNTALLVGAMAAAPLILWCYAIVSAGLSRRLFKGGDARCPRKGIALAAAAALLAIPLEQKLSYRFKDQENWQKEQNASLVYFPFYRPQSIHLVYPIRILPYNRPDTRAAQAPVPAAGVPEAAHVFLIVADTLRLSFIQPEITPHLAAFARDNVSFTHTVTAANNTHSSWFAIFYSSYPFYWNVQRHASNQMGAPAFSVFKKAGFKIHVFTTELNQKYLYAQILYYGKHTRLIDDLYADPSEWPNVSDRRTLDHIREFFKKGAPPGRHLYVIHFESTHHNYFFPKEYNRKFQPYVNDFNYFKWNYSPEYVLGIQNRYKTALAYLDSMFGEFVAILKSAGIYENAVIGCVGDHGEEFMEHGALIHGSNLFGPQTEVPIYFRIPGKQGRRLDRVVSGMDVLPTLLDAVGLYEPAKPFLFGKPALRIPEPGSGSDCALIANNRADLAPKQFALFNGRYKLCFELEGFNPLIAKSLTFTWLYDDQDRKFIPGEGKPSDYREFIRREFGEGIRGIRFMELVGAI